MLLGGGGERQDRNGEDEEDRHDDRGREEAVVVHCSACIEEHFVEQLSPTLHKGSVGGKATDSAPRFRFSLLIIVSC